jgi:hypothetical protein
MKNLFFTAIIIVLTASQPDTSVVIVVVGFLSNWPTPIVFGGGELGSRVK